MDHFKLVFDQENHTVKLFKNGQLEQDYTPSDNITKDLRPHDKYIVALSIMSALDKTLFKYFHLPNIGNIRFDSDWGL